MTNNNMLKNNMPKNNTPRVKSTFDANILLVQNQTLPF